MRYGSDSSFSEEQMGLTAIAACQCGRGSIVGYGSVYGTTPYRHVYEDGTCTNPTPEKPVRIFDEVLKSSDVEE